jgi:hypothetical protein
MELCPAACAVSYEAPHSSLTEAALRPLAIVGRCAYMVLRFHALAAAWAKDGTPFTSEEYGAPTPDWALYGAPEAGFDPVEL